MPHLQFDVNKELNNEQRKVFVEYVKSVFSEIMRTGTKSHCSKFKRVPKIFYDFRKS